MKINNLFGDGKITVMQAFTNVARVKCKGLQMTILIIRIMSMIILFMEKDVKLRLTV